MTDESTSKAFAAQQLQRDRANAAHLGYDYERWSELPDETQRELCAAADLKHWDEMLPPGGAED